MAEYDSYRDGYWFAVIAWSCILIALVVLTPFVIKIARLQFRYGGWSCLFVRQRFRITQTMYDQINQFYLTDIVRSVAETDNELSPSWLNRRYDPHELNVKCTGSTSYVLHFFWSRIYKLHFTTDRYGNCWAEVRRLPVYRVAIPLLINLATGVSFGIVSLIFTSGFGLVITQLTDISGVGFLIMRELQKDTNEGGNFACANQDVFRKDKMHF